MRSLACASAGADITGVETPVVIGYGEGAK